MTDYNITSFSPTKHSDTKTHKAAEWQGKKTVQVNDHPLPLLTDPGDGAIASCELGCGKCVFCGHGQYSTCDTTNPSTKQGELYGDRTAGFHGYSHLTGGFDGAQAEYTRVPFGDLNLIKVPSDMYDNKVLFLSDIQATGWHATELRNVHDGDSVAIWGCGPVGILAAQCAHVRGAQRIIMIDNQQYRLDFAKQKLPYLELLNFDSTNDVVKSLKDMVPLGPDVCIEAVAFHYATSIKDKIGVYAATVNGLNIGAFMEKGLSMAAGQVPVQAYWFKLLGLIREGTLTPEMVITHELPLSEAAHGYKIFNEKTDNCVKVVLKPGLKAGA
ncbi:hypothetical protein ABBQ32_013542 [Trebouxia sp. C0010 RCD-2024]